MDARVSLFISNLNTRILIATYVHERKKATSLRPPKFARLLRGRGRVTVKVVCVVVLTLVPVKDLALLLLDRCCRVDNSPSNVVVRRVRAFSPSSTFTPAFDNKTPCPEAFEARIIPTCPTSNNDGISRCGSH
jgi:hypothetical protein